MPDLAAGTRILAADYPSSAQARDGTNVADVTATSFTSGSPEVGVTFTAPTSGRVLITVVIAAQSNGSSNTDRIIAAPELYRGLDATGDLVMPANGRARGVIGASRFGAYSKDSQWCRFALAQGLRPEVEHYVRVMHTSATGSGTADLKERQVTVVPVP